MKINKKGRRFFALLLTVAMLVTTMPTGVFTVNAVTTQFAGGSGTESDPYLIETKEHLNNVRNHLGAHYKMVADIKFSGADFSTGGSFYNGGNGWLPIGNSQQNSFSGVFDGDNHTISGLQTYISTTELWASYTVQYVGLFGYATGMIKNVSLTDIVSNIYDHNHAVYVGGIAGYSTSQIENVTIIGNINAKSGSKNVVAGGIAGISTGKINSSSFDGSITSTTQSGYAYAGGIVAQANLVANCNNNGAVVANDPTFAYAGGISGNGGTISYCYNAGDISGKYAGGIVGRDGIISNCYNIGTVSAANYAGGISGYISSGAISNCYNIGDVTSLNYGGGIVGQLYSGAINNCYNLGIISATSYEGSIAGGNHGTVYAEDLIANGGTITNCHFLSSTIKGVGRAANINGTVADITGASTLNNLKKQSTYSNWDFTNVWSMSENNVYYYPELVNCSLDLCVTSISMNINPSKRSYLEGKDALSTTGGLINVIYDNGFSDKVSFTNDMVTGFDNTKPGSQDLTVTFGGKTTTYSVTIMAKTLSSISVSTLPTKVVYLEGKDLLALAGGQLTLTYNNGTTELIDITPDMVTGFDNSMVGVQTLTVSYGEKTTTFTIEVIKKTLSAISINTMPTQTSYVEGASQLNLEGATLLLSYDNDETDVITINRNMVSGFNSSTIGKKTITVVYSGMECTFDVEIVSNGINFISVTTLPTKLSYFESKDNLSVAGGKLTIFYNDGSNTKIDLTQAIVSGFNNRNVGKQTLTVTYNRRTCTFDIEIIAYKFKSGAGTESDPYLISTKGQLDNVRNYLGSHFKLSNDIEFLESDFDINGFFYNNGAGWNPIGAGTTNRTFTGSFDGNGYSIKNLHINTTSSKTNNVGLFYENGGTIKNLGIEGGAIILTLSSDVYGKAGSIAANNIGNITNCFNTSNVEINGTTGSGHVGGIVGYNTNGSIKKCYNTGIIYSSSYSAGGISGTNSAIIENCFNSGFIRSEKSDNTYCYAGGICGTTHDIVTACYNVGRISSESAKGGITALVVDLSNPDAKIENCYYLVDDSDSVGIDKDGATKCKREHMLLQNTFAGFDFENIWTLSGNSDYLYPELVGNSMDFTKQVQGISILSLPYKTQYYVGLEDFDVSGGKIANIYNDGTLEEIPMVASMVSGYDKSKTGIQTITVNYNGETLKFEVTTLALVYDFTLTTDESISLEYKANKEFDFVLSNESVAKITNVSTSIIDWGTVKVTSSAKIVPIKPGYFIVRVVDKAGYVLSSSLVLVEEGNHQLELLETIKKSNCTETGHEIYKCKFCVFQEERFPDALGHMEVLDNRVEPTCTKTGLTGGKHCSRCEEVLIKQEIIDATGVHIWDKGTTSKSGSIIYDCDTCDATYSKNLVSIKVTTKPNKLNYFEDENMDFTGMVITAYYDNNTNAQMTAWSAGYSMMEGKQTVTVECYGKTDTFTITVNSRVPSNITSSKHTINGNNISKITAGTTISSLLSGLNEGSYCKVYKGGSEASGSTAVGTGMVVKIMDGNTVKASYTIIVTGDTNGDGNITVTDMIAIKAHVLKKSTLSGVYATAADTNGDNSISITDFIQVKAKILGKGDITAR